MLDRPAGDRIFRTAMAELGTGRLRVWLMWAAASMATLWVGREYRWWHRSALLLTLVSITVIGPRDRHSVHWESRWSDR